MPVAKGQKSLINWKTESSYNVAPVGNWVQQPYTSEGFDENIETVQAEDIIANRENPSLRGGNIATMGTIANDFTPVRQLAFFRHALAATSIATTSPTPVALAGSTAYSRGDYVLAGVGGDIWVCIRGGTTPASVVGVLTGTNDVTLSGGTKWQYMAVAATSIFQHVIESNVDFPAAGLAFEKAIKGGGIDLFIQFLGCRVNSFGLTIPQQGAVKVNWNFLAASSVKPSPNVTGAGTPTLLAEDFYVGHNAYIHLNDTVGQGGKVFREFSLEYANNLDESVYCIGERTRTDLPEGRKIANGRIGMYFSDSSEYDYFKNETEVALAASLIHRGIMFKIEFPEVKLTGSGTPKIAGNGAVQQDFDWTAFYQDGASKPGKITVVCLTAAASIPV